MLKIFSSTLRYYFNNITGANVDLFLDKLFVFYNERHVSTVNLNFLLSSSHNMLPFSMSPLDTFAYESYAELANVFLIS